MFMFEAICLYKYVILGDAAIVFEENYVGQ